MGRIGNIINRKGKQDAKRASVFTKHARAITVAAKEGGADPEYNAALKTAIDKAKADNMPNDNIKRAIDKGAGAGGGEDYFSNTYEGYGPGGIAIMIDCLTDNKNRTAGFVRSTLTKRGGNLGTDGSVSYLFERKGVIVLDKAYDEDKLMEDILELDILDFISEEDSFVIYTDPSNFIKIKEALEKKEIDKFLISEVTFVPNNYISLDEETTEKVTNLIDALTDLDDVQAVYHNLEI